MEVCLLLKTTLSASCLVIDAALSQPFMMLVDVITEAPGDVDALFDRPICVPAPPRSSPPTSKSCIVTTASCPIR